MLSMKGREPYIKMQLWLEDPVGVEKLRLWEQNHLETRKRPSTSTNPSPSESPPAPAVPEKKPKLAGFDPHQLDLFKLWYQQQQQAAAAAGIANPFLSELESKRESSSGAKGPHDSPVQLVKEDTDPGVDEPEEDLKD